ncbi:putative protease [Streptomyces sp. Tu6071]|nr:putative protease [Streptomyces sp. Tu6071]
MWCLPPGAYGVRGGSGGVVRDVAWGRRDVAWGRRDVAYDAGAARRRVVSGRRRGVARRCGRCATSPGSRCDVARRSGDGLVQARRLALLERPDHRQRGALTEDVTCDGADLVGGDGGDLREHVVDGELLAPAQFALADAVHERSGVLQAEDGGAGELADGAADLVVVEAVRGDGLQLVAADLQDVVDLAGPATGVDAEETAVGEGGGVRVHAVREAALLAHLLEQARGHAPAEGRVEDPEGPAALVGAGDAGHAEHDVGLLGAAVLDLNAARGLDEPRALAGGERDRVTAAEGTRAVEGGAYLPYDLRVVDVARGGDDEVRGVVVALVEARDLLAAERVDRVHGTEDGAAEGRVAEHRVREEIVHDVARVVLGHRDLFEDDAALGVDVGGVQGRAREHVADDVDGERQIGVEHPRVVARVLLRRESVHLAADRVERGGDVERRAASRAFEEEVFEVVRRAVERRGLVAGADARPDAEGRGADRGQGLGDDAEAAGERGAADDADAVLAGQEGLGAGLGGPAGFGGTGDGPPLGGGAGRRTRTA